MTLVVNEFHTLEGLSKTLVVAAADRRLSNPDGSYRCHRRKLFGIPYLHGAISYFGLAEVVPRGRSTYLADWLPGFILKQSGVVDLQTFVHNLWDELQRVAPNDLLRKNASGFHICGYDARGLPDFWYLSNIGSMENLVYTDIKGAYAAPASHFLRRDAKTKFGWDGTDPATAINDARTYYNGDIRAHAALWDILDASLAALFQFPDFRRPTTPRGYGEYVKFKFEVIAYVYKKWAKKEIIAPPIDVIVLHNLGRQIETIEL